MQTGRQLTRCRASLQPSMSTPSRSRPALSSAASADDDASSPAAPAVTSPDTTAIGQSDKVPAPSPFGTPDATELPNAGMPGDGPSSDGPNNMTGLICPGPTAGPSTAMPATLFKPKLQVLRPWEKEGTLEHEYKQEGRSKIWYCNSTTTKKFYVGDITFFAPKDGNVYEKREALHHISKTAKQSNERGAMIAFMIDKGYVPVKSKCFYELIRETEELGLPVGDDQWSGPGRPTKEAAAKKNIDEVHVRTIKSGKFTFRYMKRDNTIFPSHDNYVPRKKNETEKKEKVVLGYDDETMTRRHIWNKKAWKGSITLTGLYPVRMNLDTGAIIEPPEHVSPNNWHPETFDICSFIGKNIYHEMKDIYESTEEDDTMSMICRLYFDPCDYPPPINMDDGGSSNTFKELKRKIRKQSKLSGSPVFCNGGGKKKRRFICAHNGRARGKSKGEPSVPNSVPKPAYCNFQFEVQWDKFGYYIQLKTHVGPTVQQYSGCPWHTSHD